MAITPTEWPRFNEPPSVAFVDVDGTLLAQTTTFLFARILYRRGLIRRSFLLRALYHGLQHRFGRLDYGRLIEIGMNYIQRIPVIELERIAYENFAEHVRPRLYEGVVEHRLGLVVAEVGDRTARHLSGLCGPVDDTRRDRARPTCGSRFRAAVLRRREGFLGVGVGRRESRRDGERRRLRRQLERPLPTGARRTSRRRPSQGTTPPTGPGARVERRSTETAGSSEACWESGPEKSKRR